jgi:hypothetical protein
MTQDYIAPIDDPRPFAEVLADFMVRHPGSRGTPSKYAVAQKLRTSQPSVNTWLRGGVANHEYAYRGLMTYLDRGMNKPGDSQKT